MMSSLCFKKIQSAATGSYDLKLSVFSLKIFPLAGPPHGVQMHIYKGECREEVLKGNFDWGEAAGKEKIYTASPPPPHGNSS